MDIITHWCLGGMLLMALTVGADTITRIPSKPHAKGIVVLEVRFDSRGPLHSFGLQIADGEEYADAEVGATRGLRFTEAMVMGANVADVTVLRVPVVGRFGVGSERFLFHTSGVYRLRWDIAFQDHPEESLQVEQTVIVQPPQRDDLRFIERIGDRQFVKKLLAAEPPEVMDADSIALGVISALLEHAESDPIEEGPWNIEPSSADELMALVRELPNSTYAPYAAYYAGGVYHLHLGRLPDFRDVNPAARDHDLYQRSDEALRFAAEHADEFLKPRAFCGLAVLHVNAAAFEEAEGDLQKAVAHSGGQGVIDEVAKRARADVTRTRTEFQRRLRSTTKDE